MAETPAQFTARLREKYKDALEKIENEGLNEDQQMMDNILSRILGEAPIKQLQYIKLSDILQKY